MAQLCINCGKGIGYGHAVSHAKNRVKRLFKPNLQKLKVLQDGYTVRVKMCTSCIQRLKKDGSMGIFKSISFMKADEEIKEAMASVPKAPVFASPQEEKLSGKKKAESMKIEDIVGKK